MRGKDEEGDDGVGRGGIIPAGAGKRPRRRRTTGSRTDHPRGCGEKGVWTSACRPSSGSSPRVRGKVAIDVDETRPVRIIPAGAGKSRRRSPSTCPSWDHPRGCGEKSETAIALSERAGSSPRVRGKGRRPPPLSPAGGIIPAGAGKRDLPFSAPAPRANHPRGCGEKGTAMEWNGPP